MLTSSLLALFAFSPAHADIYFQTPPGSNNRLDEQNRERANGNRVFDSQNNNRGGYNVGKMTYYAGEKIPISWTNQHGSSKYQMEHSEFVIQYMCEPLVRDGTTTRTIPTKATECQSYDCDTDVRFGRHESYEYYEDCTHRRQNEGLLTINQNLRGDAAKYTRQNPQGTRHGYECPEERDHYPYWNPTPWRDAMIVTADKERCAEYQRVSQNVMDRTECRMPDAFFDAGGELRNNDLLPIVDADCTTFTKTANGTEYTAELRTVPAWGIDAPECVAAAQSRANHLGMPGGRTLYGVEWAVPDNIPSYSNCVLRIRYNITTAEYEAWESAASIASGLNATYNSPKNNPNANQDPSLIPIWEQYGIPYADIERSFDGNDNGDDASREYVLKNNPQANAFATPGNLGDYIPTLDPTIANNDIKMQLAINTAQFGRTFQDRTHYWTVIPRPADLPEDANIILQTVRGKRGNIVQTFPATEYFFEPEDTYVKVGDYVDWQWTGSNTNPNNNDGQGKQGTDRSNVVPQRTQHYDTALYSNFEHEMSYVDSAKDHGTAGNSYPAFVQEPFGYEIPDLYQKELVPDNVLGGISVAARRDLATTRLSRADFGNMEELDDAGTSFRLPLQKMEKIGSTNYLCTRNNNFSNRAQKGKFTVAPGDVGNVMVSAEGGWWGDSVKQRNQVTFWPGSLTAMERAHIVVTEDDHTSVLSITGVHLVAPMTVQLEYAPRALQSSKLMWQAECDVAVAAANGGCSNPWVEVDNAQYKMFNEGSVAMVDATNTGSFKVVQNPNWRPILALTVAILALVAALGYVLLNKCGDHLPERLQKYRRDYGKNADIQFGAPKGGRL